MTSGNYSSVAPHDANTYLLSELLYIKATKRDRAVKRYNQEEIQRMAPPNTETAIINEAITKSEPAAQKKPETERFDDLKTRARQGPYLVYPDTTVSKKQQTTQ